MQWVIGGHRDATGKERRMKNCLGTATERHDDDEDDEDDGDYDDFDDDDDDDDVGDDDNVVFVGGGRSCSRWPEERHRCAPEKSDVPLLKRVCELRSVAWVNGIEVRHVWRLPVVQHSPYVASC